MVEITGTPLLDWLLTQTPVVVVLSIISYRLEGLVAKVLDKCQDENEKLTAFLMDQAKDDN